MKKLSQYFKKVGNEKKKILVTGHPHADPDVIGSIVALGKLLESLGAKVSTGIPSNISRLSKSVLNTIGEDMTIDPPIDADIAVVLDTSSLDQMNEAEEKIKDLEEIIFIDHHRPEKGTKEDVDKYYVDENSSSTAELVLQIAQELDFEFDSKTAMLMLTGIISDTGHFRFANERTFSAVTTLLESGADYKKTLEALKTPEDPSKKTAMLKAAQRSELHKSHGRWIVFSKIGAYESDAASLFVKIGADVALVASENEDEIRVSSRSRSGVASKTHLHLGELMSELADSFNGTGGGHAGAAGMSVQGDLKEIEEKALKELEKMLKPKSD